MAESIQTVYINNLNEKIKPDDLKVALYALYSQFGPIVDMVLMRTAKMRGQAFVVYDNLSSAAEALRQTQGFIFYDRPIRIAYAKSKSDAISKRDGTFVPRPRGPSKKRGNRPEASADGAAPLAKRQHTIAPATSPELLISNIPADQTELALSLAFKQFSGFVGIRFLPPPESAPPQAPLRAIAKFQSNKQASVALYALQDFAIIPGHLLQITSV